MGQFFQQPPRPDLRHDFSKVPGAEIERSTFDRSFRVMTTFDAGFLIPFLLDDVLPADTYDVHCTILARLNTPRRPLFDDATLSTFFFNVPYRICQDNFVKMMGEQINPTDSIDYAEPLVSTATSAPISWGSHTNWDYFGFPTSDQLAGGHITVSAYPFRALYKIWNRHFRDQNLQDSLTEEQGDATFPVDLYAGLLRRGKRHDYFTSCLPWPQKGDEVLVPLGNTAPLVFPSGVGNAVVGMGASGLVGSADGNIGPVQIASSADTALRPAGTIVSIAAQSAFLQGPVTAPGDAYANLALATGTNINAWRLAFQTQRLLERSARGGTRFPELVHAQFSVTVPDYRVQYPEYIGGGRTPLMMNPVPQTTPLTGTAAQGDLAGVGAFVGGGHGFTHSFVEHGLVLGLLCVDANLSYCQGIERQWRGGRTRYDFYTPAFAHLGEQGVLNQEIFSDGSGADKEIFGYQEAWAEYRYKPNRLTGLMRTNVPLNLSVWHLAQNFTTRPLLNSDFIESQPPFDRVVQVPDQPHFTADIAVSMRCTRPMPTYSVPGMIDHF